MKEKGFGIIELVIVIAVVLLISQVITVSGINLRKSRVLNNSTDIVKTAIKEAQEKTLGSEDSYQYGAHFDSDKVVVFRGSTYSSSDTNNVKFLISDETEMSSISLSGGGSDIVFAKITGKASKSGTITVRVKIDTSMTKVLTISTSSAVSIQ